VLYRKLKFFSLLSQTVVVEGCLIIVIKLGSPIGIGFDKSEGDETGKKHRSTHGTRSEQVNYSPTQKKQIDPQ